MKWTYKGPGPYNVGSLLKGCAHYRSGRRWTAVLVGTPAPCVMFMFDFSRDAVQMLGAMCLWTYAYTVKPVLTITCIKEPPVFKGQYCVIP